MVIPYQIQINHFKNLGDGFHKCVNDWCNQQGTNEQYTKCEKVSPDGKTCYNPEIRYGSTASGSRPIFYPGKYTNISQWCKQLFPTSSSGTATYATDEASNANIPRKLFWAAGFNPDEDGPVWSCRCNARTEDCCHDGWKDQTKTSDFGNECDQYTKQDCVMASVTCQF